MSAALAPTQSADQRKIFSPAKFCVFGPQGVQGTFRCTIMSSDKQSEEKAIALLKWLLSIAQERKRGA